MARSYQLRCAPVVVYSDGEVILSRKGLRQAKMTSSALSHFLENLQLERLREAAEYTITVSASDMSTTVIIWRDADRMRSVSVCGPVNPQMEKWGAVAASPEAVVSAVERLRGFEPESTMYSLSIRPPLRAEAEWKNALPEAQ